MVKPRKPSCFLSHGTISHSISSVNSVSEFGFKWTTTLRATNVNLPGVGLGFLACDGSSPDDTVHVVVRFSTQAFHCEDGAGWWGNVFRFHKPFSARYCPQKTERYLGGKQRIRISGERLRRHRAEPLS